MVAFLTLLRGHRFLGIADRQIREDDGLYRAHIVVAAVRRELRTLTRFLLVQGVETFATSSRQGCCPSTPITSPELEQRSRGPPTSSKSCESPVEALAMEIHAKVRSALDGALPELHPERGYALSAERMRNGIREVRATVKDAAKQLSQPGSPGS